MIDNMDKVKMLEFPEKGDERGHLVIVESEGAESDAVSVPFDIKRIFYIYGTDDTKVRGNHANRKSEFVLINVAGQSKVKVRNGKGEEEIYNLDRPRVGIYLPPMVWKEMYDFSPDSVLLVLASTHYEPNEYIRDYVDYVKAIEEGAEN